MAEEPRLPGTAFVRRAWKHIGYLSAAVVLIYCVATAFEPPRLNWGDTESDYNTMIAGRNFDRYGFVTLRLTPHLIDRKLMTAADTGLLYTHYPQLPDVLNGAYRKLLHIDDVIPFRLIALCWSFGSLFFAYRLFAAFWGRQTAQIALTLLATNTLWVQFADYLHHGPYGAFFGFGSLYFLDRFLRTGRRRLFVASGVFLFFAYLASYDYWIFTPLLLAAITWLHLRSAPPRRVALVLAQLSAFAVGAIVLKAATNVWAMGTDRFFHDLRLQFVERSTDRVMQTAFDRGIWPTLHGRIDRQFTVLMFGAVAFWLLYPLARRSFAFRTRTQLGGPNPLMVLGAALPFLLVFRELWVAQFYPFLMLVPFYAIGFAAIASLLIDQRPVAVRAAGFGLIAFLVATSVGSTLRFPRVFVSRQSLSAVKGTLDSAMPPNQWVLSNAMADSRYRYYFDRQIVPLIIHRGALGPYLLDQFSDPNRPPYAGPGGAVYVEEKHLPDQLFDKGYYWPIARFGWWEYAARPEAYRGMLDLIIRQRDSSLAVTAATIGRKLYEDDHYILWSIPPSRPLRGPIQPPRPFRLP